MWSVRTSAISALVVLIGAGPVRSDIVVTRVDVEARSGTAIVSNGVREKDLDRWRVGGLSGWAGCIFVGSNRKTGEELCGCLGRQRSSIGSHGVELALENVKPCPSLLIEGAWNASWSPTAENRNFVTFRYDPDKKALTGCWSDPQVDGKIAGSIEAGVYNARDKSLFFRYRDSTVNAVGEATLTLASTPDNLTLRGAWTHPKGLGSWIMVRDPIRTPLDCTHALESSAGGSATR